MVTEVITLENETTDAADIGKAIEADAAALAERRRRWAEEDQRLVAVEPENMDGAHLDATRRHRLERIKILKGEIDIKRRWIAHFPPILKAQRAREAQSAHAAFEATQNDLYEKLGEAGFLPCATTCWEMAGPLDRRQVIVRSLVLTDPRVLAAKTTWENAQRVAGTSRDASAAEEEIVALERELAIAIKAAGAGA
jgi:hypothetical protein